VWIGEKEGGVEEQVGLECLEPSKSVFGMDPPAPGSFYDEYKRVEAELHRSEDRYKRLFENSLGLICTHDIDGVLLSLNPAAAIALGYEPDLGVGTSLAAFLAPSVRGQLPEYLRRMRERGHDTGYMLIVASNRTKHVWLYRNFLVREDGHPPYVVGHAMDVTEQKIVEYQLESTLKELQSALAEVKTLKGLLPICAWCKKIRTEAGDWIELESYITAHSDAHFSHGVCSDCIPKIRAQGGG
jgi:PAS domain S-box-containing protein